MLTLTQTAATSTCQKRAVVCELYDAAGNLLARAANKCSPPGGVCQRLNITSGADSNQQGRNDHLCLCFHAEIAALTDLAEGAKPHRAVVYGHEYVCAMCRRWLVDSGVKKIEVRDSCEERNKQ